MNNYENSFMNKIVHSDEFERITNHNTKSYVLSKIKHKNIYVFYNKKNIIVVDKRKKEMNVYSTLKTAANKLKI